MNYHNIAFEASYGTPEQLPPSDLPELAFCGRSNVGKSSMLNRLWGRKSLARVSAMPGKTATVNFFRLEGVRFADLPGYGFARVSKGEKERWSRLMEGYFKSGRNLHMVFLLFDMRHPPSNEDLVMLEFLRGMRIPFTVVLTKADKLSANRQRDRLIALSQEIPGAAQLHLTPFSSKTGLGVAELHKIIESVGN